jgi:A/G-specific adenine glycosylase
MQRFPTVFSLAEATDEEVNSHWAGLGFYRRVRLLHSGAKRVVDQYNGLVPNTVEELMKVEGIGRYTASAIASIAYGVEVPVVDGNVCRVLCRLTGIANHIKAGVLKDDLGWMLAERIIQAERKPGSSDDVDGTPGEVNQALMELGATYCCPGGSGVDEGDPLRDYYISCQLGVAIGQARDDTSSTDRCRIESLIANKPMALPNTGKQCRLCDPNGIGNAYFDVLDRIGTDIVAGSIVEYKRRNIYAIAGHASLPIPPPKKSKREEVIAVAVVSIRLSSNNDRCWLMVKRPPVGLLSGQWEFPAVCVWNSAEQEKTKKPKNGGVVEVPLIDPDVRSSALDAFLNEIFQSDEHKSLVNDLRKRKQMKDAPVVHVFSHVCHTMWVEHVDLGAFKKGSLTVKRWEANGRGIGWLSEGDMESVGITSGVRKVLAATQRSKLHTG